MGKNNNFLANDQEAREKELRYLSWLYELIAGTNGSYKFAHGEDDWARALQQHGVDVEVRRRKDNKWDWYDNKIVNPPNPKQGIVTPYTEFCIETLSCSLRGKEKEGWVYTCRADKLTYAFELKLPYLPTFFDTYVHQDMPRFKKWFQGLNLTRYHIHTEEKENRTRSVLIPVFEVLEEFPGTKRYLVFEGFAMEIRKRENFSRPVLSMVPELQLFMKSKESKAGNIINISTRKEVS